LAGIPLYQTAIRPEWIDYNGHLRDAYYGLIVSEAADALMDRVGLDATYRARTGCTLYTVEMHLHFLHEVKQSDTATVAVRVLGADHKRIHAAFEVARAGHGGPEGVAAIAELLLLHVRQQGDSAATTPLPPEVSAALARLAAESAPLQADGPPSRRIELRPSRRAS
jgi:acyl-CoA thioester hydrolase